MIERTLFAQDHVSRNGERCTDGYQKIYLRDTWQMILILAKQRGQQ